ncbi:MAG: hybrid sensor histidine kinase/response regulator, partial [Legionella sp.]
MIKHKNSALYYEALFNLSWQHSKSLFLLLSDDLTIQDINPAALKVLKLTPTAVINRHINELLREWFLEPVVAESLSNSSRKYSIWHNNQRITIHWTFLSAVDAKYLLIGEIETTPVDIPLEIIQLENVLKFTPGLLYWKDINSVYLGCNDEFARLAGLSDRRQVKGKTDFELIWKDRASSYVAIDQSVMKSGKSQLDHIEIIAITNEKIITAITSKVPMRDHNNKIIGIIGITTDITHQKEIEAALSIAKEQAEAANLAKIEFIANMSHDIRTPLTGVIGLSEILEQTLQHPEEKEKAHLLHDSGEELLHMLNDILDDIRADHLKETDLKEEAFSLHQCIKDLIRLQSPATTLKGLALKADIATN